MAVPAPPSPVVIGVPIESGKGLEMEDLALGPMDGVKVPITRREELMAAVEAYQAKLGVQPWRDFVKVARPEFALARPRLEGNLATFRGNYAVLSLVVVLASVILSPQCLLVIAALAVAWGVFARKNADENWKLSVGGVDLNARVRSSLMALVSGIILLYFEGHLFLSAIGCSAVVCAAHAACHPAADQPAGEEDGDVML
eukprot:CAMPEP_0204271108 /NCGR_PEP_ID=MMETSP0468-20130131/19271_1 /ASSEMBLY_ACC=CAM_ASM_000383 /TAXON_ID=2969 /ORGANISM="Oxyrrhis marina" /LENGTH=199 /DNA_ID=CAMNT_0051246721 /DNA_START=35 /DNA_END=634 /DNA_ORIENTATION=-